MINFSESQQKIIDALEDIPDNATRGIERTQREVNAVLDKIRAEIQKVINAELDFTSENAKAQAIALNWCLEIIDKYAK